MQLNVILFNKLSSSQSHPCISFTSSYLVFLSIIVKLWSTCFNANVFRGIIFDFLNLIKTFYFCLCNAADQLLNVSVKIFHAEWRAIPKDLTQCNVPGPLTTISPDYWRILLTLKPFSINQLIFSYQSPSSPYKSSPNFAFNATLNRYTSYTSTVYHSDAAGPWLIFMADIETFYWWPPVQQPFTFK